MATLRTAQREAVQSIFREGVDNSSFGPLGYISRVSAGRLKGFIGYIGSGSAHREGQIAPIDNANQVKFIGEVVSEGINRLSKSGSSRLSVRALVRNGMLERLQTEISSRGASIEASLPANDTYTIVYIGYNTPQRELSSELRDQHNKAIEKAISSYGHSQSAIASLAREIINQNNYSTRIVGGSERQFSSSERERIYQLLSTFGYNNEGAENLITNDRNIIGLVYKNIGDMQTVVGISVTERRSLTLTNGANIHIAEVTDGTVSQESNGKSLYSRLLSEVFVYIAENFKDLSIIYAESNVSSAPLLKTAAIQGRTFSGILPNHANIMNRNTGQLELKSLAVTYMTREQILEIGGLLRQEIELQKSLRA